MNHNIRFKCDSQFQNLWQLCSEIDNQYKDSYTTHWPLKIQLKLATCYMYINQCCWNPECNQWLSLPIAPSNLIYLNTEPCVNCVDFWCHHSEKGKRQDDNYLRCNKQTMGFNSVSFLRVLMDAWVHCCWSLTIYKPESVLCTNDKALAL